MKVALFERESGKYVVDYNNVIRVMDVDAPIRDYVADAWRCAVADRLVNEVDRPKYIFRAWRVIRQGARFILYAVTLIVDGVERVEGYELFDPRNDKTSACELKKANATIDAAIAAERPQEDHGHGHGHSM